MSGVSTEPISGDWAIRWSKALIHTASTGTDPLKDPVIVEDAAGHRLYENLAGAFERDGALILRRDTTVALFGKLAEEFDSSAGLGSMLLVDEGHFRADPTSWACTHDEWAFEGDREWVVEVNGEWARFDLNECQFAAPRIPIDRMGIVLELDTGQESKTTDDIGLTMKVDAWGGVWVIEWGALDDFRGILDHYDPATVMLDHLAGGYYDTFVTVRSELLTFDEIILALGKLVKAGAFKLAPDCRIAGRDRSGIWKAMVEQ